MGSSSKKQKKKEALFDKLQLLRAVTHSSATNKTSIIVDATRYIEELKEKVERLSHDEECTSTSPAGTTTTTTSSSSSLHTSLPMVKVEPLEKGFVINVVSENNCPGLLVCILEVFHELGLDVLDARVSCSHSFQLQAIGGAHKEEGCGREDAMDAEMVKQAVQQAITNWNATSTTPHQNDDDDDDDI